MSTVALDIWTGAYPSIANDITINVYNQSDPLAIVTTLTHAGPTHLADTWSFPGLDRVNLLFRIFETSGGTIIQQLGEDMNVVPGSALSVNYKVTEQIEADTTTGFSSGVNSFTMDGTGGKEDWTTWDVSTVVRMGASNVLKKGIDYSWNIATGQFTLLMAGDLFNPEEWLNISFAAQVTGATSSVPTSAPIFSTPKIITADYNINAGSDFGGLLIIRPPANTVTPSANFITLTLPLISTVVPGKLLTLEMAPSTVQQCAQILCQTGESIDWLLGNRNNLYMRPQESISFYKFIDTSGMTPVSQWRVYNPFGNFLKVGEQVVDDNIPANVFNKILMAGNSLDNQQYAALYNDFVLNLDPAEVCNYDNWATGNNIYLYSLANSANPAFAGQFHIPNRLNTFERTTDGTRKPGNFQAAMVLLHDHVMHGKGAILGAGLNWFLSILTGGRYSGGGSDRFTGMSGTPDTNMRTGDTGGSENRPANIAVRKYLLV